MEVDDEIERVARDCPRVKILFGRFPFYVGLMLLMNGLIALYFSRDFLAIPEQFHPYMFYIMVGVNVAGVIYSVWFEWDLRLDRAHYENAQTALLKLREQREELVNQLDYDSP